MRNEALTRNEVQQMIDVSLAPWAARILNGLASTNKAFAATNFSTATLNASPSALIAANMVAKKSGLFLVMASGTITENSVGPVSVLLMFNKATTAGATITVNGATPVGSGISNSSGSTPLTFTASSGAMSGLTQYSGETALNSLASSALVSPWAFAAIVGNTNTDATPVPLGNSIAFCIAGSTGGPNIQLTQCQMSVFELGA